MHVGCISLGMVCVLMLALTACGGGSDGDNSGSVGGSTTSFDVIADEFVFVDQVDVMLNTQITSDAIKVSGINASVSIQVEDGEYSIDSADFTASAGTVSNGQSIRLRLLSANSFSSITEATLTIGGVSDTFRVTTVAEDKEPDGFVFQDQVDVALNTQVISNGITVSGINTDVIIRISGGEYSIDNGAYTSLEGTVVEGQAVTVRQVSSNLFQSKTEAVLSIGTVSETFSVTTVLEDRVPDAFVLIDRSDVGLNTEIVSDSITVSGINIDTSISISGGEYSIDGGAYTSFAGMVANGQSVSVRQTSSPRVLTSTDAILNIGGVSDVFTVITGYFDINAPQATIHFPPAYSTTTAETITVSGVAWDESEITNLQVNGVNAASTDGFATWSAEIPLLVGQNDIVISATDAESNTNSSAASATLMNLNGPLLVSPNFIEADQTNNRLFITDIHTNRLYKVDLNTGAREIVSSDEIGSGPSLNSPYYVDVDNSENRVFVLAANTSTIIAVDLDSGNRSVIFRATDCVWLNIIHGMTYAPSRDRIYLLNDGDSIVSIDPDNGTCTGGGSGSSGGGPEIRVARHLAYDSVNDELLTINVHDDYIVALDLGSGTLRYAYQSGGSNDFPFSKDIAVDLTNNRALVTDLTLDSVLAVDLSTGSYGHFAGSGVSYESPLGIATTATHAYVVDASVKSGSIISVDLSNGERSVMIPEQEIPGPSLEAVNGLAYDHFNNRILVVDPIDDPIWSINPGTGSAYQFSSLPFFPFVLDTANDHAYAITEYGTTSEHYLYAIDLNTGSRTSIDNADWKRDFDGVDGFSVGPDYAYVIGRGQTAIRSINLQTGEEVFLSYAAGGVGNGPALDNPRGLDVDLNNDRLLTADQDGGGRLLAVDLSSGDRTVISDNSNHSGDSFVEPEDLVFDASANRAIVLDKTLRAVIAVDMTTGARSILSGAHVGSGENLIEPENITLDPYRNILVTDDKVNAVFVIDPNSGHRVIISR